VQLWESHKLFLVREEDRSHNVLNGSLTCKIVSVTKRCRTLSGHNVVEGKDFKNKA